MKKVQSADGTTIAFDQLGKGPALILVGGSACVFGISSGAALAMEAAIRLSDKVKKLAMYEAPYNSDDTARQAWKAYRKQLAEVLEHRSSNAGEQFKASAHQS
jgi:thioesterase domain-containing protein